MATDFKTLKEKSLDGNTTMKVKQNIMSGRIFVEFISENPRMTKQRTFQDTYLGKIEAAEFSKSIKNTDQLMDSFGIKKGKK